jgi:hypothetical protein
VARDADAIQAEIERARDALAVAVDELSNRVSPHNVIERGKQSLAEFVDQPKVKYSIIGVAVIVVLLVIRRILR